MFLRRRSRRAAARPGRFAGAFGALAAVAALYGVSTQPGEWTFGSGDSGSPAAWRRLETVCGAAPDTWTEENACPADEATTIFRALASVESCVDSDGDDISAGICSDGVTAEAQCTSPKVWIGGSGTVDISGNNFENGEGVACAAAGGTYTPAVIDASDADKVTALKAQLLDQTAFPINGETCKVKGVDANGVAVVANRAESKAITACANVRPGAGVTYQQACEAVGVCDYTAARAGTNADDDWFTEPLCNLIFNTNRPAPAVSTDELVDIMAGYETHDAVANGGAAVGVLDASDFNKMLSKPIFQIGWFLFYVFCTFYLFCGIAIVCDDFFTASLEVLSIKFDLSEDVAGATFMAAGSSAPELFTSLSAVIVTDPCANRGSVGIGTIVGSAIFNILVIIGATCMLAGQVLQLGWKPMIRDTCWYALSIALLIIFVLPESVESLRDQMDESMLQEKQLYAFDKNEDGTIEEGEVSSTGLVTWWEGLIMWLAYFGYIVFMKFNSRILGETSEVVQDEPAEDRVRRHSVTDEDGETKDSADAAAAAAEEGKTGGEEAKADGGDDDEEEETDCLGVAKEDAFMDQLFIWFSYPWYIFFMITIPNCESDWWKNKSPEDGSKTSGKEWFGIWFSFINSIIWIGFICFGMVEFAILIGQMCDISSTVMGLTVLSAGTSVPDAISSIVVAQRGLGDMAISNALGSNVFDILLGLGFPYFLSALIEGHPVMMCVDDVSVYLVCLVVVLIIVVGTFSIFKFQLRPVLGIILIVIYILFFFMAVLRDQNVIDLGVACDAGH